MNRQEKQAFIDEIGEQFRSSELLVLADYNGMNVETMNGLRRHLGTDTSVELRVVKNTLCNRAISGTPMEVLSEHFVGPTAVVMGHEDPVSPAKLLQEFLKDHNKVFKIKAGYFSGGVIGEEELKSLSRLPSREELLAQLLATLRAPSAQFVGVLAALPQKLVGVLEAQRQQLETEGG